MTQLGKKMEIHNRAYYDDITLPFDMIDCVVFTPEDLKQHEEALLREGWDAALSHEKEVTLSVNGTRLEKIKMRTYDSIDDFLKSREKE